jgi:recombination protein RecT
MSELKTAVIKSAPTVLSCIGSDVWKEEVAKVIPKEIALEALLRVARSTASDPKFNNVDPKSFLLALLKCARAGLYPDGREAHLIAFGKDVQTVFDVKGICSLASRAGVLVTPKLVFSTDKFSVEEDDGNGRTRINHSVDYRSPRGEIQAVYSRAVMKDGQVDYEIMSAEEVEDVRQRYSKAKDSSPWKNSWGEMAKKTVIKRHSKRWDMSPEIRQAFNADDDSIADKLPAMPVKPIFGNVTNVESPKTLAPAPSVTDALVDLKALMEDANIAESTLIEFMQAIGLADENIKTLEEAHTANDVALQTIIKDWEEFSQRIKETV